MFKDLISLIYPQQCAGCGQALVQTEKGICVGCWMELKKFKHIHLNPLQIHAKVKHQFLTYFFIKNDVIQHILHQIKYHGNKDAAFVLGNEIGLLILQKQNLLDIDLIVPVPISKKKLKLRGYNQSEEVAKGIAHIIKKPINTTLLKRAKSMTTQTKSSRFERWENMKNEYHLNKKLSKKASLLLVDDVITTGATIHSCVETLKNQFSYIHIAAVAASKQ